MHIQIEVPSECLCHDGTQWTADQFQRILELNAIVFDLHLLVFGGWNDLEIPAGDSRDEFHDECEVVVRPIVEVDWQSIVLLVKRELEIAFGATHADVLPGLEVMYLSLSCRVYTCHMCMMSYLVVLEFLVAEWTHGCCTKVPLDLRCDLQ